MTFSQQLGDLPSWSRWSLLAFLRLVCYVREVVERLDRRPRQEGPVGGKVPLSDLCQVPDPCRRDRLEVTILAVGFCARLVETLGRS